MDNRKLRYLVVMLMALVTSGIGARRMAPFLKPKRVDFLDIVTMDNHLGLIMVEAIDGSSIL